MRSFDAFLASSCEITSSGKVEIVTHSFATLCLLVKADELEQHLSLGADFGFALSAPLVGAFGGWTAMLVLLANVEAFGTGIIGTLRFRCLARL